MFSFDADTGEIFLYDTIGPSQFFGMETGMIDAASVQNALAEIGNKKVLLRINSPGGVVDEGIAIYNLLERHPAGVDVSIDALAASAASFVALVGNTVTIAKNGAVMIHKPMMGMFGNSVEMRKGAELLDTYEARIMSMYEGKVKLPVDELTAALEAETWYTAKEAVDAGFADKVGNPTATNQAIVPVGMYSKTPNNFLKRKPETEAVKHVDARLRKYLTK
jgi:ATP-dependent protease ClpP protease subunit